MNKNRRSVMRELPVSERPYEKCMSGGAGTLSDAELLAVILKSGSQGQTAVELASELLSRYESHHTLAAVTNAGIEELSSVPGIGQVKAIQLECVGELARRIAKEEAVNRVSLLSLESIATYFMEEMRQLGHEEIRAAFFDSKNHLLRQVMLSKGTVNASIITPREVFMAALKYHAVFVVLVHNHPSGDPEPSRDDIMLTDRIRKAGGLLQIPVLDHIIIGDNRYISFKERGII